MSKLDIELTERCNNTCVHCYINLPKDDTLAKRRELPTEEWKKILSQAVELGCLDVRFTGGEPLLREDFEELYVFARRSGLRVSIFTNAALITPRLAELFSRIPPLNKIEVSVYGMKRSSYEAVTNTIGSFEAAQIGIALLLENQVRFVVKSALLPQNKNEIAEFEGWASSLPGMDHPPQYAMFFSMRCRRDDPKKNGLIRSLRLSPEEGMKILTRDKDEYINGMAHFCEKFMKAAGNKLFACGAGKCSGCVDAYGTLQPCMFVRHPDCVYDLKQGSLKKAFENFFPKIRKAMAINRDYLSRCGHCFLKGLCDQCPGNSWMEHGTLDIPVEYLCDIAHAKAKFLGLIKEGEKAWEVKPREERKAVYV